MVKEVHGSGGYGMLIGPLASRAETAEFRQRILAAPPITSPKPTLALSTRPSVVEAIRRRAMDLRPFVLSGGDIRIVVGGLSRVAMQAGLLAVNSAQAAAPKTPGLWRA